MNQIRQHIPNFVDGVEPHRGEFATLAQLREIPFVKQWLSEEGFHRLSVSDGHHLIAELRGGREWWVIGYLREPVPELPEWDGGVYEVILPSGEIIEVPGREVLSSRGGEIRIKDGRVLKSARWS